jgi:hypothetical protein
MNPKSEVVMQICRAVLLTFVIGNIAAVAEPILTPAGSGAFQYTFSGNTLARFGATGVLTPGIYEYFGLPLPFSSGFSGDYLTLSDDGVFIFESRDLDFIEEWVLTPTTPQVPGLGITVYDSVTDNFYATGQLLSTNVVPGSASLVVSSAPEPTTPMTILVGLALAFLRTGYPRSRSLAYRLRGRFPPLRTRLA